ncbi:inositol polyphosphate multikinase [Xylariaceae sp. FL0804]|nr:inositol polyphosphate multikinase [Xylariaceae sp. FL0804]
MLSRQPLSRSASRSASNKGDREIPKHDDLVNYNYAVAGHAGTMCDADGELFIKPCTKSEVEFYESAQSLHPEFAEIMPLYIGTLSLNENTSDALIHAQIPGLVEQADIPAPIRKEIQSHLHLPAGAADVEAIKAQEAVPEKWVPNKTRKITTDRAVVLENASFGYSKPNIMDAKLGYRLWADDAPVEKKQRFDKIAAETTHKHFGFRVAGMRVYQGSTDPAELDDEGYRVYDKDWGRFVVNDDNLIDSFRKFIFNKSAGIDEDLGKTIAGAIATDLRRVQEVLEQNETRMYSSSVLFVFEGDGAALRAAIAEAKAEAAASSTSRRGATRDVCLDLRNGNLRVDSGIGMDDEELKQAAATALPVGLDELEMAEDSDEESAYPRIYSVKMIDFAHATWRPGEGPDENVLQGVRSLVGIFDKMSQ